MRIYEGDGFKIGARWKEEVSYSEGDHTFWFDAGWGHDPGVLYVPDAAVWDKRVPAWMKGRRDEIVARLACHSGHVLAEDHE